MTKPLGWRGETIRHRIAYYHGRIGGLLHKHKWHYSKEKETFNLDPRVGGTIEYPSTRTCTLCERTEQIESVIEIGYTHKFKPNRTSLIRKGITDE
jgi:hypothetical protein